MWHKTAFTVLFVIAARSALGLTCADLDGAYVVSEETPQVYLGFFGNQFAADSIENQFGTYGSQFNASSVRDPFGPYGSSTGPYSANNQFTSTPPFIAKNQVAFLYLTTNTLLSGGISLATIDANCPPSSFFATQPTLTSTPPPFTLTPGLSGNWDDPDADQGGHGFQIEMLPNNTILVIWFVFTPDGKGQVWLFSIAAYDPTKNTVTLPAYISVGPKFPPNYNVNDRQLTQWGTITLTFSDCDHGTAAWTSTASGYPASGNFPIGRVTTLARMSCP